MVEPIDVAAIKAAEQDEMKFDYNFAAASPLKAPKELKYSHFSRRYRSQLGDTEVFSMRFNQDASMTAITFADGSL